MVKTRRGVYHNLLESDYTVSVKGTVFYFSSVALLKKFLAKCDSNRQQYDFEELFQRNKLDLSLDNIADISLYRSIEKRGFRLSIKGVEYHKWQKLKDVMGRQYNGS